MTLKPVPLTTMNRPENQERAQRKRTGFNKPIIRLLAEPLEYKILEGPAT
jgi:hypothetical protein